MTVRRPSLLLICLAAAVCVFLVLPTLIVIPISFTQTEFITFPPRGVSLRWYEEFFARPEWRNALASSFAVATGTTVLATVLGVMVALGLDGLSRRSNRVLSFLILLPMIVPTIVTAAALYTPYARFGLVATIPGLIVAHTILALPFVVINVAAVLRKLDHRTVDAARSLGASPAVAFRRVTLPALRPGIAAGGVFAFLTSFDEVVIALFISGASATTLPVRMWSGIRFEISPIVAAASTLLLLSSCLLLSLFWLTRRK
ncbi:ABC transporter permease [Microbaculum sp. FT89]|uniref:ABC transporter permease n=1 Tax=Microbaculum sp. FT89 TaxID=3447298 RepID=UPI003F5343C0